jgi:hypothetical protein
MKIVGVMVLTVVFAACGGGGTPASSGVAGMGSNDAMTDTPGTCYVPALQRELQKSGYTCNLCTVPHGPNPTGCLASANGLTSLCVRDCSECS